MGDLDLLNLPTFLETPSFERRWKQLGLSDESLAELQWELIGNPEAGEVVKSAGGFRKMRFVPMKASSGKSGGLRVYYLHVPEFHTFILGGVHAKNEVAALNAQGKAALKQIAEMFQVKLRIAFENRNARKGDRP